LGTGTGGCWVCVSSSSLSLSSVSELEGDELREGGDFLLCISCTTSLNRSQVIHLHCSMRETAAASAALFSLVISRVRVSIAKRRYVLRYDKSRAKTYEDKGRLMLLQSWKITWTSSVGNCSNLDKVGSRFVFFLLLKKRCYLLHEI
jgi:hypothetical protein